MYLVLNFNFHYNQIHSVPQEEEFFIFMVCHILCVILCAYNITFLSVRNSRFQVKFYFFLVIVLIKCIHSIQYYSAST